MDDDGCVQGCGGCLSGGGGRLDWGRVGGGGWGREKVIVNQKRVYLVVNIIHHNFLLPFKVEYVMHNRYYLDLI